MAGGRRKHGASRFPTLADKRRSEISMTGSNLPDPGDNQPSQWNPDPGEFALVRNLSSKWMSSRFGLVRKLPDPC